MRTEVRTERKINFATFCPDPPTRPFSWGGGGPQICDDDDADHSSFLFVLLLLECLFQHIEIK